MCLLASGPQRRPLLLQMYSVQQQGQLPGRDAPDGNFHPREVSCSHTGGKTSEPETEHLKVFFLFRDASWELEANAYSELLEVYTHCDADVCLCGDGRTHSAKTGYGRGRIAYRENSRLICGFLRFSPFEVVRCRLCGSRGTHRKCSRLKAGNGDWACGDCTEAADGEGVIDSPASRVKLCSPPQRSQRRSRLSKRHLTLPPHISSKRYTPRGKRTSCVRSGQQGALSPRALLSFGDLSRFVGIQMVYLASSLKASLSFSIRVFCGHSEGLGPSTPPPQRAGGGEWGPGSGCRSGACTKERF